MTDYKIRLQQYNKLSESLSGFKDTEIEKLFFQSDKIYDGIGGSAKIVQISGINVFVKSIPLTELEEKSENLDSLENLFKLPLFCHYGVGSPGFTSWRELSLHELTTSWVIENKCIHFPILYHWRKIPRTRDPEISKKQLSEIQNQVQYWDGAIEVGNRIRQKSESEAQILLFLEYIPYTLYDWVGAQLKEGKINSLQKIQSDLNATNQFMYDNGLIHFDAHFENLLTDGDNVYYTDFGLSLSRSFKLTGDEEKFFLMHKNYDDFSTLTNFLHAIVTNIFSPDVWNLRLEEYINGELGQKLLEEFLNGKLEVLEDWTNKFLKENGPAVLRMDEFYRDLQHKSKSTPYPADELDQLRCDFNSCSDRG